MNKRSELLCACGGKCEGPCRKEHLYRERKKLEKCPAAYKLTSNNVIKDGE